MIKKIFISLGALILLFAGGFFLGPRAQYDTVDNTPSPKRYQLNELDQIIQSREATVQHLKEDNEARVVWADSIPTKTEYSIVYLHGFSASQGEGYPMHLNLADSLHANMYLPRLPEHGVHYKDAMKDLTPEMLVTGAKDAISIGKSIGDKVVVVGCSTGGTLGIYLAAGDPDLEALVLLSPNIAINSPGAAMMTGPWGRQIAMKMIGEHRDMTEAQNAKEYWSYIYHTNGLIALQALMDQTMTEEVFDDIKIPVYCGYFYKDEEVQDPVVSVAAMLDFQTMIESPAEDVEFEAFERGNHVLGSVYKNEHWAEVQDEVLAFLQREVVGR